MHYTLKLKTSAWACRPFHQASFYGYFPKCLRRWFAGDPVPHGEGPIL